MLLLQLRYLLVSLSIPEPELELMVCLSIPEPELELIRPRAGSTQFKI